jgi:hypothetical protein
MKIVAFFVTVIVGVFITLGTSFYQSSAFEAEIKRTNPEAIVYLGNNSISTPEWQREKIAFIKQHPEITQRAAEIGAIIPNGIIYSIYTGVGVLVLMILIGTAAKKETASVS